MKGALDVLGVSQDQLDSLMNENASSVRSALAKCIAGLVAAHPKIGGAQPTVPLDDVSLTDEEDEANILAFQAQSLAQHRSVCFHAFCCVCYRCSSVPCQATMHHQSHRAAGVRLFVYSAIPMQHRKKRKALLFCDVLHFARVCCACSGGNVVR